jgi:hypothetical protein
MAEIVAGQGNWPALEAVVDTSVLIELATLDEAELDEALIEADAKQATASGHQALVERY